MSKSTTEIKTPIYKEDLILFKETVDGLFAVNIELLEVISHLYNRVEDLESIIAAAESKNTQSVGARLLALFRHNRGRN